MEPRDRTSNVPAASPDSPDAKPPERVVYFRFRERPWTYLAVLAAVLVPVGGLVYFTVRAVNGKRVADWPFLAAIVSGVVIAFLLERRLRKFSPAPKPGARWEAAYYGVVGAVIYCFYYPLKAVLLLLGLLFVAPPPMRIRMDEINAVLPGAWRWAAWFAAHLVCGTLLWWFAVPRVRARLRTARGQCPACGYSLQGLPGPSCPECGRLFGVDH